MLEFDFDFDFKFEEVLRVWSVLVGNRFRGLDSANVLACMTRLERLERLERLQWLQQFRHHSRLSFRRTSTTTSSFAQSKFQSFVTALR